MNYQEPWQTEGAEALETEVLGLPVAWTVDDDVYVRTGDTSKREDGYMYIGTFPWEDGHAETYYGQEDHNIDRLHEYVVAWIKANRPDHIKAIQHQYLGDLERSK